MLRGLGGEAAGGSRCRLPDGLEQGSQGCCALYMDPGWVRPGGAVCPPLQSVSLGDCRGRRFLPLAVGIPDGMAAGYFYLFFVTTSVRIPQGLRLGGGVSGAYAVFSGE